MMKPFSSLFLSDSMSKRRIGTAVLVGQDADEEKYIRENYSYQIYVKTFVVHYYI